MSWLRWLSLRRHRMTYFFSTWFCSALSPEGSGFKLPREAWRSIMMSSCMGFTSIPSKYNYIGFPIAVLLLAWAEVMLPSSKLAFSFLHTGHVEGLVVHSQPLSHCLVRPCFLPSPDADLSMESSRCAVFCLLERRPSERLAPLYASRWHTVRLWHSSHYHRPRRLFSVTTLATLLAIFPCTSRKPTDPIPATNFYHYPSCSCVDPKNADCVFTAAQRQPVTGLGFRV